jgi:uncharacterized phage protein (TIGR02220 family)
MSRGFKGIWIPKEIWESKGMSMQEKIFLAEIHSLDNEQGCIASNAYFAEFFGLSKSSVSRIVSSLVKKNLIKVILTYKPNKEVDKRIIRCEKYGNKEVKLVDKVKPRTTKLKDLYITDEETSSLVKEVIHYLNKKAEKNFRNTNASAKFIVARRKESYSLDDFKRVIDVKCSQWINTDFDKFLRPSTLFNATKFQEYLSEKFIPTKKDIVEKVANSQKGFYDV